MADFQQAIEYVLGNEGGYCNDPDDPGGETNFGICKRDHPDLDIRNMTKQQADAIYRAQYWCYDGIKSQELATKLLDWAVNLEGTGKRGEAIRALQQAINQIVNATVPEDGAYGPLTEHAANRFDQEWILRAMTNNIQQYRAAKIAANPRLKKFDAGWRRRDLKRPLTVVLHDDEGGTA